MLPTPVADRGTVFVLLCRIDTFGFGFFQLGFWSHFSLRWTQHAKRAFHSSEETETQSEFLYDLALKHLSDLTQTQMLG